MDMMKSFLTRPSFMITCIIPFRSATSVPGVCCIQMSANRTSGTRRGSAMMSFAPFRFALIIFSAIMGWFSLVFEPMTNSTSLFSISCIEFVIAPEPNTVARPTTVVLCQRRAQ